MCPTYLNTVQGDVGRLGVRKRESLCGYEGQLAAEPGLSGEGVPHQCPCHYHHRIASWRGERGGGTPYESTFLSGQKFMFPKSDNTNSYLTQEKMLRRESVHVHGCTIKKIGCRLWEFTSLCCLLHMYLEEKVNQIKQAVTVLTA